MFPRHPVPTVGFPAGATCGSAAGARYGHLDMHWAQHTLQHLTTGKQYSLQGLSFRQLGTFCPLVYLLTVVF